MNIRPVSDLRNKFTEIEKTVQKGQPVYLTKNGYGVMVVLSIDTYTKLTNRIEYALDLADKQSKKESSRLTHEEVFSSIREDING